MLWHLFKFFLAVALVPLVAAEVWTLIDLAHLSLPAGEWRSTWFISFGAGFLAWLLIFAFLPRTMWLYVLGHEFTHALAAILAGGKVSAFKVSASGGHVMTDRVNWWITLSPYFIPIYALIWTGLWLTVDFYYPLGPWQPLLYFGAGLFWSFHLTFTVSMLHLRQTDLSREGYFFPVIIILLINLLAFLILFSLLAHGFAESSRILLQHSEQSYFWAGRLLARGAREVWTSGNNPRSS